MSSSSNLSVSNEADGGRDLGLPSFTALRGVSRESDKPASGVSGSRRSARSSTVDELPKARDTARDSYGSHSGNLARENGTVRRSRPHSSGGFLLDTALHPRRAFLSRSNKENRPGGRNGEVGSSNSKGKRPREESEIVLPKRRARALKHEKSPSISGSPLATEIKRDEPEGFHTKDGLVAGGNLPQSTFLQAGSTGSGRYGSTLGPPRALPSVGYDTDPAQIVNMALSLNEKRRRQASGTRMTSSQSVGTRATSGAFSTQVGQTAQFTTPVRWSPQFSSQTPDSNSRRISGISEQPQAFVGDAVTMEDETDEVATSLPISQATETRVQRARAYFELAYEHRRLLSHLPPIRRPGASLEEGRSKIYNPLQYCRNRKLRFSEKHPIAAEAEGWHDIDQVRDWVDAIIEAHTATRHDPDECVRLPDLAHHKAPDPEEEEDEDGDPMSIDSPASSLRKLNPKKHAKPTRPRSDWVTHPGDIIADAYWLEQGQNKLKILDRDNNKIYPPHTRLKFSGWRNRTPVNVPERLQEQTLPSDQEETYRVDRLPTPPPSALPELPTFRSTHKDKILKRSRRKNTFRGRLESATKDRKFAVLDGGSSESSSSVGETDGDGSVRGRKRISRKRQGSQDGHGVDVWKLRPAPTDRGSKDYGSSGEHSFDQSANSSKRPSVDHVRLSKFFSRDSKTDSSKNNSKTRSGSGRRESTNGPPSRGSYDGGNFPRSSAEYDTTAPTSPTGLGFPSIAINLSPPASRSPSPSKKAITSILNPFRDRSQSKVREGIEANDFGKMISHQETRKSSNDVDPGHESSDHASRGTSPMTRGKSPMTKTVSTASTHHEPESTADEHRGSTVSRLSTKSTHTDGHSRVRGVFKGGRIAQLVGNEVSKVGEYIWKRDAPPPHRRESTTSTLDSYHDSDSDDGLFQNGFAHKTPPQHEKRFPTTETEAQRAKRHSPSDSQSSPEERLDPRYHNPNLPSFTSPFQKDKDLQDERKRNGLSPTNSLPETKAQQDHISHLAAEHRNATKSPRMDRLAPPKLNMSRSASPGAPFTTSDWDRRSSYGFGEDRDFSKSRNASQIFNNAIMTNGTMVTGLSSIDPTKSRSRSRVDLFRAISHQSASSAPQDVKDVSKRDIAFTGALLMSSAVKAREIALRADTVRDPVPAFLLNTVDPDNRTLHSSEPLRVRRKEEHVVAARNLITRLEKDGQRFQVKLQAFQSTIIPNLHCNLQGLEDLVDNGLTPRVRKSGDEAGELSMKLSTTSTLAVKDVNERIDAAMRRRRRGQIRWLRRFGYLCIEWVVVALLWGIWAIVSVLRVARAVIGFMVKLVRWLLFL